MKAFILLALLASAVSAKVFFQETFDGVDTDRTR
jgi:hypothetical protein